MYLLDTNALLIFLHNEIAEATLTNSTKEIIATNDDVFVGVVSLWEMAVKVKINKLELQIPISEVERGCRRQNIGIIPIKSSHLDKSLEIPLLKEHKDPFDRLILATSLAENMTLISTDWDMRRKEYNARVIW